MKGQRLGLPLLPPVLPAAWRRSRRLTRYLALGHGPVSPAADGANPTQFLNSQELTQYMSRRAMDNFLSLGLSSPNQLVRAMSLKGLTSILMDPKKVRGGAARSCARKASRRRHARRASPAGLAGRGARRRQARPRQERVGMCGKPCCCAQGWRGLGRLDSGLLGGPVPAPAGTWGTHTWLDGDVLGPAL